MRSTHGKTKAGARPAVEENSTAFCFAPWRGSRKPFLTR